MNEYRFTVSSLLSASRVLIILPVWFCILGEFPNNRTIAVLLILIAVGTDFLDGYLARKLHQVTELGKIIDPLADKLAIGIVAAALLVAREVETWFVAIVVLRDLLILAGGLYIRHKKKIIVQSNWPGKFAVSAVALTLTLTLLRQPVLTPVRTITLWLSVVLLILSFGIYTQRLFIGRKTVKA